MRVLLVEDDPLLGKSIEEFLTLNKINTNWIQDDRELEYESLEAYDVVVLDLMLKYNRGEDLLVDVKRKFPEIPVLILTAKRQIEDKETCFKRGADDYLTKPFEPRELLWRLKTLSRRHMPHKKVKIGSVSVDVEAGTLQRNGDEVKLSKTAWKLLIYLLKHRGEVLPKERIINYIWNDKIVGEELLRAYIKELRKVLPKETIKTYKGRGYKLVDEEGN